jgi:hypothetical protein
LTDWDGVPSPLWRKRLARHTRSCPICVRAADELIPAERLLAAPAPFAVAVAASSAVRHGSAPAGAAPIDAVASASGPGASGRAVSAPRSSTKGPLPQRDLAQAAVAGTGVHRGGRVGLPRRRLTRIGR